MKSPRDSSAAPTAEDLTGATVGRYVVSSRLGAGAMGEVYLAQHTQLRHYVAIKRLAAKLRSDHQYHFRLLRDGQRASALIHPHIARVYDVLEEKGELLLVMEYVEGTTLRQRLKQRLGREECLDTAIQCGEALDAAHQKGILHGDIKPENIMLTPEHQVKVLDFGVARRLPVLDENAETQSLQPDAGTIAGTPAYMAPEVLLLRPPDARADVFSLGVVCYEMLSGRHPFLAEGFTATTDRILHEQPPALSQVDPDVPEALSDVVAKAIAKDPTVRYASARELADDLRAVQKGSQPSPQPKPHRGPRLSRPVALGVLAVVALALIIWSLMRPRIPVEPRLAILGFTSLDNTPESEVIGKGIRETLNARVAQLAPTLDVVPTTLLTRNSDGTWRETPVDSAAVARQAHANLVLRGTVYINGSLIIVRYVLTNIEAQKDLSGDVLEGDRGNLFPLEEGVARSVISRLGVAINPQVLQAAEMRAPANQSAYEPYLEGRGYLENYDRPENIDKGIAAFQRALALDSGYALAYSGLGEAYLRKYAATKEPRWVGAARLACEEALARNSSFAEAHICLGRLENATGEYGRAVAEFKQALEKHPSDAAYIGLATAYENLKKPPDAESTYRQAISLRPDYWVGYNWLGTFYLHQARYAEAAGQFGKLIQKAPDSFVGYSNLGITYLLQGNYPLAITMLERSVSIRPTAEATSNLATAYFQMRQFSKASRIGEEAVKLSEQSYEVWGNLADAYYWAPGERAKAADAYRRAIALATREVQVNPHSPNLLVYLADYHAMLGERGPAMNHLSQALALAPQSPEVQFNSALVHYQFGEIEQALDWLEKAVRGGYPLSWVRDTPNFDTLHTNPRFQQLLKRK
jgi:serine/threonine-protein kinase